MRSLSLLAALAAPLLFGAVQAQTAEAPLVLSLTAGGTVRAEVWPGGPLLLMADVLHRDAYGTVAQPVTVAPTAGPSWAGAISIEVRDAAGALQAWHPHAAPMPSGALHLTGPDGGQAGFWLSPDETAALTPGTYTIRAVLDSTAVGASGLYEAPRSVPVLLTVHAAADAPSPDQALAATLRLADYYVLDGAEGAARALIDEALVAQPDHPVLLTYRADLLREAGEAREAVATLERAQAAARARHPESTEPSAGLAFALTLAEEAWDRASTFEVTVAEKGLNHPYSGQGPNVGYYIDGTPGEDLYLERGRTYTFRLAGVPAAHPFYLTTSADGAGAQPYTQGVEGAPASGDGVVTFTPDETSPALLYYQSAADARMGWRLHMISATPLVPVEPGAPATPATDFALSAPAPNPTSGRTGLTLTVAEAGSVVVEAYDLLGRRVATLYAGPAAAGQPLRLELDTAGLPAGTYVVRAAGRGAQATRRLTVAR